MLDKVCKRLPDAMLTSKCDDLVKKYEDDIIKFLLEEFDPKKLCTTLGFCSKSLNTKSEFVCVYMIACF